MRSGLTMYNIQMRNQDLRFRVQGLGFRVQGFYGLGFRIWGLGFRDQDLWLRVQGQGLGFRIQGLQCRIWSLGFRVQGLGFMVQGLGFKVQSLGFRVKSLEFQFQGLERIQGLGFRVQGFGFRVQGLGFATKQIQVLNLSQILRFRHEGSPLQQRLRPQSFEPLHHPQHLRIFVLSSTACRLDVYWGQKRKLRGSNRLAGSRSRALRNRAWSPELEYSSLTFWIQLSNDKGVGDGAALKPKS